MIETEKGLSPLLDINPQTPAQADEFIHVALQDMYEKLEDMRCIKDKVPIMESAPPQTTAMGERRQILEKIIRLQQAI